MAISSTFPAFIPASATVAAPTAPMRPGLLARCRGWLIRRDTLAQLQALEPHLARDIGAAAPGGGERCPEGFAADPRPLWGIGLTPQPMDVRPPRAERCKG